METAWLTTKEAADYTRRHPVTVLRAAEAGELTTVQPSGKGGHRRYRREWLDSWLLGEPAALVRGA